MVEKRETGNFAHKRTKQIDIDIHSKRRAFGPFFFINLDQSIRTIYIQTKERKKIDVPNTKSRCENCAFLSIKKKKCLSNVEDTVKRNGSEGWTECVIDSPSSLI